MINSSNGYDKLKEVVVGKELSISNRRVADFTFKHFFQENLNESVYDKLEENKNIYTIRHELLEIRNKQLDIIATKLEDYGVIVSRPNTLSKIVQFQTPDFKSELSSASNIRDTTIIIDDTIVETPTYVQNRYFENTLLYDVFNEKFDNGNGGKWVRPPLTKITESTMDLDNWDNNRDFTKKLSNYTMAIDGAQFLRLNNDIICNVSTYNHYLGYKWVESLFPHKNFYMIKITDNHIDGTLLPLCEGKFLINTNDFTNRSVDEIRKQLPKYYQDWQFIEPKFRKERSQKKKTNIDIKLASSRGMDINILNIDPNTLMINDDAKDTMDVLDKNGFNIVPVKLDNCEIFGGGIHCSTLDIHREC
jgi:glycine amidinotransferase